MGEDVERAAEEIIKSFLESIRDLPETKETYYSQEMYNITRPDGQPAERRRLEDFRRMFLSNAPRKDEEGNIGVEVAAWTER